VQQALRLRGITALQDIAVGIKADEVRLACGAGLASDVSIIATGAQAPTWLGGSGLKLNSQRSGRGQCGLPVSQPPGRLRGGRHLQQCGPAGHDPVSHARPERGPVAGHEPGQRLQR
jgi:hypothetical protein